MFMKELDSIQKPKEEEKRIQLDTTTEMFNPLSVTQHLLGWQQLWRVSKDLFLKLSGKYIKHSRNKNFSWDSAKKNKVTFLLREKYC